MSDNGPSLVSNKFEKFLKNNGIKHVTTAPYHPSSNGQAERYVRTVKEGLKKTMHEKGNLKNKLTNFLMCHRRAPHATTNISPDELMFGRSMRTKLNLIIPKIVDNMSDYRFKKRNRDRSNSREFSIGDKVQFKNFTTGQKWFFGIIKERIGSYMYKIECDHKMYRRHVDHIIKRSRDTNCKLNNDWTYPIGLPLDENENVNEDNDDEIRDYENVNENDDDEIRDYENEIIEHENADREIEQENDIAEDNRPTRRTKTET